MNCPLCQNTMVKAKATNFGEEYDYCRTCKKELSEMADEGILRSTSNSSKIVWFDPTPLQHKRSGYIQTPPASPSTTLNPPKFSAGDGVMATTSTTCGSFIMGKTYRVLVVTLSSIGYDVCVIADEHGLTNILDESYFIAVPTAIPCAQSITLGSQVVLHNFSAPHRMCGVRGGPGGYVHYYPSKVPGTVCNCGTQKA